MFVPTFHHFVELDSSRRNKDRPSFLINIKRVVTEYEGSAIVGRVFLEIFGQGNGEMLATTWGEAEHGIRVKKIL